VPILIEGLNRATLSEVERNAYDILTHIEAPDLAAVKHLIHVGMPAVLGPQTLTAFVEFCRTHGIDLTTDGVDAFKAAHNLGNTGANAHVIGNQTAKAYFDAMNAKVSPPARTGRHITPRGLAVIENFEGLRLKAYQDDVKVWTIGFGHTAGVYPGQVITREQADELLRGDVAWAEDAVNKYVKVPLNDNQFDALVSFTFNCGAGALAQSTTLRKLNAGDYQGAADALLGWVNGDHGPLPGLVSRRREERGLFLR
jgi:lysozyme